MLSSNQERVIKVPKSDLVRTRYGSNQEDSKDPVNQLIANLEAGSKDLRIQNNMFFPSFFFKFVGNIFSIIDSENLMITS